jgi:hypothetical protein
MARRSAGCCRAKLNVAIMTDLVTAANRGIERRRSAERVERTAPQLADDIDDLGAAGYLAAHSVPIIGPEVGAALLGLLRRLETLLKVYPPPDTVEVYRLALYFVVQVAAEHQKAFCARLDELLDD